MGRSDDCSVAGTGQASHVRSAEGRESAPGPKRRRIGLACSACRIRKSRCNGVRPKCEHCERLGFECIYELTDTSANLLVPKDLFATLEEKVRVLELSVGQQSERLAAVETRICKNGAATAPVSAQVPTAPSSVVVSLEGIHDPPTDQSMTDGMAISFVDEQDCGFFGPSSNIAFMRHIFRTLAKKGVTAGGVVSPQSSSNIGLYQASVVDVSRPISSTSVANHSAELSEAEANTLPPHHETQALIHSYFSNTGLLFPFIHEQSFIETYERLRSQNFRSEVRRTWLGLLNMILAMALCTTSLEEDGTNSRAEQSDIYYYRARELCKTQMLRGTTLETVQYLLLMSQYLQGTQKSVQTWNIHGLAIKAAMSIGLHSSDALAKFLPLEQEMRKRTWFGCILLDRSLSMTFGRPCLIPEEYVKLDLPKPIVPCGAVAWACNQTSISFFNSTILLYRITWKTIGTLYDHNLGCGNHSSETTMITNIFNLEQQLNDWSHSLPPPLFLRSSSNLPEEGRVENRIIERLRLILSLRYLNLQLLVHRPMLVSSLGGCVKASATSHRNQGSLNHVQTNCNRTCVRLAEDIIEIIHNVLTKAGLGRDLIGAWWFTLYYVFNAALSIFGSLLVRMDEPADGSIDASRLDRGRRFLEKAIEGLSHLGPRNAMLGRCIDYLKQLSSIIDHWVASTSPTTLDPLGSEIAANSHPISLDSANGNVDMPADFFHQITSLGLIPGFEDELESGNYFVSEVNRWF